MMETSNIQHPTPSAKRSGQCWSSSFSLFRRNTLKRELQRNPLDIGCSMLDIQCSFFKAFLLFAALIAALPASAAGVRLRDLAMVSGARDNQLVGYGLVAGLAGDGDKDPIYTK